MEASPSLYSDDAIIFRCIKNIRYTSIVIQRQLNLLLQRLRKWRASINAEISEAICTTNKQDTSACLFLPLGGKYVAWKTSVKYSGVSINTHLSFTDSVNI